MSSIQQLNGKRKRKQRLFLKDVAQLLWALGDPSPSNEATITALDDILVEWVVDLCHKLQRYAKAHGRTRVKMDDVPFTLRNDPAKLARFQHLTEQIVRILEARRLFDDDKFNKDKRPHDEYDDEIGDEDDGDDLDHETEAPMKKDGRGRKKKQKVTGNIMTNN
ncbi:Transcription initiation factor TFIID subunit 13 [Scheffersomyces spartinae]|uniref:Transcription initiation factor TFIID subunit 13 n=1 Tax=Scheffersomyces spartinae TaxID=45513 RepID=A0A9P8AHX2_9ASCO|nr:Transcription initiation factor TFIID subunit 13 [Scheffersomyces spartinae]KAG7193243.1 Transcription initiation factor TFIID subunit 13 [Scheffersomyces spartinae]